MQKNLTLKYECGCGKIYSSYPAFSTHKKQKHKNQQISGTNIPKGFNPKRGRPSFSFTNKQNYSQKVKQEIKKFEGLTIIQCGLLELNTKYDNKIMSNPEYEFSEKYFIEYEANMNKYIINQQFSILVETMKKFNKNIVIHLQQKIAQATTQFIKKLTIFLLKNYQIKVQQILQWEHCNDLIDFNCSILIKFFEQNQNIAFIQSLNLKNGLDMHFFVEITIILSEWLYKMGNTNQKLKLKL